MDEEKIMLGFLKKDGEKPKELFLVKGKRGYFEIRVDGQVDYVTTEVLGGLHSIPKKELLPNSKLRKLEKSTVYRIDDLIEASTEVMEDLDNTSYWVSREVITKDEARDLDVLRKTVSDRIWKKITELIRGGNNE